MYRLLLIIFLAGCASASANKNIDYLSLAQTELVQGQSTKEDVLRLFGKPLNKTVMNYQIPALPNNTANVMPYEMWSYGWRSISFRNKNNKTGMAGLLSPVVADQDVQTLVINFNREGKFTGYTSSEASN